MIKKIKPVLLLVSVTALLLAAISGCSGFRDISINSFRVESVFPRGLRTVQGTFKVGIVNPAPEMTVSDISAVVFRNDRELGTLRADPVVIPGRRTSEVSLPGVLELSPSVSFQEILAIASNFNPDDYYADISLKVKIRGGISKKVKIKRLPVRNLLNIVKNERI